MNSTREAIVSHHALGDVVVAGDDLHRVLRRAHALAGGADVICDRFTDSTLAYQGYGDGLPLGIIRQVNAIATGGLVPDLTVLLDLDVALGLRRKQGQEWNAFDDRDLAFHGAVRAGFLTLAAEDPGRWLVVDAAQPLPAVRAAASVFRPNLSEREPISRAA